MNSIDNINENNEFKLEVVGEADSIGMTEQYENLCGVIFRKDDD